MRNPRHYDQDTLVSEDKISYNADTLHTFAPPGEFNSRTESGILSSKRVFTSPLAQKENSGRLSAISIIKKQERRRRHRFILGLSIVAIVLIGLGLLSVSSLINDDNEEAGENAVEGEDGSDTEGDGERMVTVSPTWSPTEIDSDDSDDIQTEIPVTAPTLSPRIQLTSSPTSSPTMSLSDDFITFFEIDSLNFTSDYVIYFGSTVHKRTIDGPTTIDCPPASVSCRNNILLEVEADVCAPISCTPLEVVQIQEFSTSLRVGSSLSEFVNRCRLLFLEILVSPNPEVTVEVCLLEEDGSVGLLASCSIDFDSSLGSLIDIDIDIRNVCP